MEVAQLRNFLRIAELENFTRAAEEVGLSQPAISRSISRLEEELGQPVFERQARKVTLTDAGELLKTRAQQILALIDDTKSEISDDGRSGKIRLGAIPTIAPYLLPPVLKDFHRKFPEAHLIIQEETTDRLLKAVSNGTVDLALMALPIDAKYLEIEELFEEELLLVHAPEHPLAKKNSIRLKDIEDLPFVILGETHCLADNILSFCRQRAFHPVTVERTNQMATVQELVALNHGISMVPEMARRKDKSKNCVYRSLAGAKPQRRIAMVWNSYRFCSKLLISFQEFLREYCAAYNQQHG